MGWGTMADNWLEIPDEEVNVQEIMRQIRERIAARDSREIGDLPDEDPKALVTSLWEEIVGDASYLDGFPLSLRECDIVPRGYIIQWRVPILGPIHAIVRRLINAEIRRYLLPALEKQSAVNRKIRSLLKDLVRENARLRRELNELRERMEQDYRE